MYSDFLHLFTPRDPAIDVSHFKDHGAHILVGTPGRIDDIMKRCTVMEFKRLEVRLITNQQYLKANQHCLIPLNVTDESTVGRPPLT